MKIELNQNFITDNSNECENGCFFLLTQTNEKYKDEALKKGARIVFVKEAFEILNIDKNIKIIGITGTNGKTTTAAAIYSVLLDLGYKCALCGTRGAFVNDKKIDEKGLTTSQILTTLSYLKQASDEKCHFFVMEVSSHAIAQNRIDGLEFALKIFTNLSQDHLDYHKTFDEYIAVKSSFLGDETPKLINKDDKFIKYNLKNTLTYGLNNQATFQVPAYSLSDGITALVTSPFGKTELNSNLEGEFNLYNILAAFGAVSMLTKREPDEISKAFLNFAGVCGRVEKVSQNPLVIVDFAHTPDGIEKVLNALKNRPLIVVFGAGGDRDRTKRPIMGKIAQRFAKFCIVTSDNPRSEDPNLIISEILSGMKNDESVFAIENRKDAIKKALNLAQDGDMIVILGKGDEDYQEIKGVKYPFSDKEVVLEILKEKNEN